MNDYQQELAERVADALAELADNVGRLQPHEPTVQEVHDNAWNGLYAVAKSIDGVAVSLQNIAEMIDLMQRNPLFRISHKDLARD